MEVQYSVRDAQGRWANPQEGDYIPGLGRLLEIAGPGHRFEGQTHLWLINPVPNSGYTYTKSIFLAQ